jgi:hypothetical protein
VPIPPAQGSDERQHISIPPVATEAHHRLKDTGQDRDQHHLSATPPLDVPLHARRPADQAFDRVGVGQEEAHAFGGAGIPGLRPVRQIVGSSRRSPGTLAAGAPGRPGTVPVAQVVEV